jgi:hypothetical protein
MREVGMAATEENVWPQVEEEGNSEAPERGLLCLVHAAPNITAS